MVISIKAEKAPGKIQQPFPIKTLSTLGIQGHFPNLTEGIHEILNAFSNALLFNSVLEVLANAIGRKKIKGNQIEKQEAYFIKCL